MDRTDFDSRALGPSGCFIQRISAHGPLTVRLARADNGAAGIVLHTEVLPSPANDGAVRAQHLLAVAFGPRGPGLVAPPGPIRGGDAIVFFAADEDCPAFTVDGSVGDLRFSSASLAGQSVYVHWFGQPGCFTWGDANGSGLGGEISVQSGPPHDVMFEEPAQSGLVRIADGRADPARLSILAGQCVYFAVEDVGGMTITDTRLLADVRSKRRGCAGAGD